MTTRRGRALVAIVAALLVAGTPLGAAAKNKKAKNAFTVVVNGTTIKLPANVSFTAGGTTVAFMALGQTRIRKKLLRTASVACGDFPPATIPGTSVHCTAQLQEMKVGRHPSIKAWFEPSANLSVTFTSYDGATVAGSFDYASIPSTTGDPPISFSGQFSGRVRSGN